MMKNNTLELELEQEFGDQSFATLRRLLGDRSMMTLTVNEFLTLIEGGVQSALEAVREAESHRQARGWKEIAKSLKVSTTKAQSLFREGVISDAIIKDGGVILCDVPKALKLYKEHTHQRSLVKLMPLKKTRSLEKRGRSMDFSGTIKA